MFEKGEFSKLRFNVYLVKHGKDLLQEYPKLAAIKSFKDYADADRNRLIRYIVYMYDKDSPLVKRFQKIEDRQRESALLAGYDINKYHDRMQELYSNSNPDVTEMIVDFIVEINSRKWAMINSNEATFYEFQRALMTPIDRASANNEKAGMDAIMVKSKMMEESDIIDLRLDKYYEDLFGSREFVEYGKRKRITPESVAAK